MLLSWPGCPAAEVEAAASNTAQALDQAPVGSKNFIFFDSMAGDNDDDKDDMGKGKKKKAKSKGTDADNGPSKKKKG